MDKDLLAVLIALSDLQDPLSTLDISRLEEIAAQLYLSPETWESHSLPILLDVLKNTPRLEHFYNTSRSQLMAEGMIPSELIPTQAELEAVLPQSQDNNSRGIPPITTSKDSQSHEIMNIAVAVFASETPSQSAKKLSRLNQLKQFLLRKSQ